MLSHPNPLQFEATLRSPRESINILMTEAKKRNESGFLSIYSTDLKFELKPDVMSDMEISWQPSGTTVSRCRNTFSPTGISKTTGVNRD